MIACITPTGNCYEESISTLRFAERAKKVKTCARVNLDPTTTRIMELEAEVMRLRQMLKNCHCGKGKVSFNRVIFQLRDLFPSKFTLRKTFGCCGRASSADTVAETSRKPANKISPL
jgi:hypothetical protein